MQKIKLLIVLISSFLFKTALNLLYIFLPATVVFILLAPGIGEISLNGGLKVNKIKTADQVHEILPNTQWSHLRPCGEYFDEQEAFRKGVQCANGVWQNSPLPEDINLPRCFIVTANSPDIFSDKNRIFNFIPIKTVFGISAVVGVYQPETRTVFVVENVDSKDIYSHEIQHYFLHIHDPETEGGGHDQEIWQKCAPPYYNPSSNARAIAVLKR